jgi:Putative transposase
VGLHVAGAVTFVQRFDSALRLNVHFHSLVLDGVYVQGEGGRLDFRELPAPTPDEVLEVARSTAERVTKLLARRSGETSLLEKEPALAPLSTAAAQGTLLFGERAGQKAPRSEVQIIVDATDATRAQVASQDASQFLVAHGARAPVAAPIAARVRRS